MKTLMKNSLGSQLQNLNTQKNSLPTFTPHTPVNLAPYHVCSYNLLSFHFLYYHSTFKRTVNFLYIQTKVKKNYYYYYTNLGLFLGILSPSSESLVSSESVIDDSVLFSSSSSSSS